MFLKKIFQNGMNKEPEHLCLNVLSSGSFVLNFVHLEAEKKR